MGAVGGAVVAGVWTGRGAVGAVRVGRGYRGLGGTVAAGATEVAGTRTGAVRMSVGVSGVARVGAGVSDGFGEGSRCSLVDSTNGMTVSGVIGPPAKLTPTMTV